MIETALAPSCAAPRRFEFRNHARYVTSDPPQLLGFAWAKLPDSGTLQRYLSGSEGSEMVLVTTDGVQRVVQVPPGQIVLIEQLPQGGWLVSVPSAGGEADADDADTAP